jgi:hypothetical protein
MSQAIEQISCARAQSDGEAHSENEAVDQHSNPLAVHI